MSYHTVPVAAAGSQAVNFHFTMYPSSQVWSAQGNAGGVDCDQNLTLFSSGLLDREGSCSNMNFFNAKIVEDIFLGIKKVSSDVYFLGFFNSQAHFFSITDPYFQTNYVLLESQPMLVSWTKL